MAGNGWHQIHKLLFTRPLTYIWYNLLMVVTLLFFFIAQIIGELPVVRPKPHSTPVWSRLF
jgi:high-affinity nickel permease